jgi:2-polyprenyl-3-methyl-5-hydroxy-6-metoxy-1,4-benzoquinol methylase
MACLDIGCGGGDVSFDLARLVGPNGRVVGIDIDEVKIDIARSEAAAKQLGNIEFRLVNIGESDPEAEFDFAHVRFLLSHLPNPVEALAKIRPGGILVVADTD